MSMATDWCEAREVVVNHNHDAGHHAAIKETVSESGTELWREWREHCGRARGLGCESHFCQLLACCPCANHIPCIPDWMNCTTFAHRFCQDYHICFNIHVSDLQTVKCYITWKNWEKKISQRCSLLYWLV